VVEASDDTPAGLNDIWSSMHVMLSMTMRRRDATAGNNMLLWWMGIHVTSAALSPGQDDYITHGRFRENPVPMDINLCGRAVAMTYYAKIVTLDDALNKLKDEKGEIESDLFDRKISGKHVGKSKAWEAMLGSIRAEVANVFAREKGTAMARIVELEGLWCELPTRGRRAGVKRKRGRLSVDVRPAPRP
jgi:hypothetical protein